MLVQKSSKFNEEKFDIIFSNLYSRKSTNRHKDDYTIIYFEKITEENHLGVHIAKVKFSIYIFGISRSRALK